MQPWNLLLHIFLCLIWLWDVELTPPWLITVAPSNIILGVCWYVNLCCSFIIIFLLEAGDWRVGSEFAAGSLPEKQGCYELTDSILQPGVWGFIYADFALYIRNFSINDYIILHLIYNEHISRSLCCVYICMNILVCASTYTTPVSVVIRHLQNYSKPLPYIMSLL